MLLYNKIEKYFKYAINYTDFVLGLDETGLYLFTESGDDNVVREKASKLSQALALQASEIIVVQLTSTNAEKYQFSGYKITLQQRDLYKVSPDEVEAFIRLYTGLREPVLTEEDICSIIDCFMDYQKDYGDEYDSLVALGIEPKVAEDLVHRSIVSLDDVFNAGVPVELVDEAFSIISSHSKEAKVEAITSGDSVFFDKSIRKNILSTAIALAVAIGIGTFTEFWYVAAIFSVYAMFEFGVINEAKPSPIVKLALVLSILITLYICMPLFSTIVKMVIALYNKNSVVLDMDWLVGDW